MIEKKSGNILHIGSIASFESAGSVGYNTVKAAISGYVRSIGSKLLKDNVILTAALLGGFIADGNSMARLKNKNLKAYNEFIDRRLPRKKMGTAEELIPMLTILCSPNSGMYGGCLFPMDAGEGKAYFT
jgi:NAD(P)-dependent dehydrogenase (short-subunit alcohol dehydrogenase family)